MSRAARAALAVAAVAGACGGRRDARPPAPTAPATTAPAVRPADGACAIAADAEILVLAPAQRAVTSTGLAVTFTGASRDEYDDGRFDVLVALQFRAGDALEERLPSALAPHPADEVHGHCWQLVRADERSVQIAVSRRPDPCDPMPREGDPCKPGDGYCVISWGEPGGWSAALWCRDGAWVHETEVNLD